MTGLTLRPASEAEFATAVGWARDEGWNPGLDDLAVFHGADREGFLMGWLGGEPVSCISVVRYGADFGFLGFYIVRPEARGAGHGIATWRAGMAHLREATPGRVVGLDGVVAQQENYRRSGFVLAGRNIRHQGVPVLEPGAPAGVEIRPLGPGDGAAIAALDRAHFGFDRAGFIGAWTAPSDGVRRRTMVALADGVPVGFGTIRACHGAHKVGPLFAPDRGVARALLAALAGTLPEGAELVLDPPEPNGQAIALAEEAGLAPVFETARMYAGPAPDLPLARIWGITTFELG